MRWRLAQLAENLVAGANVYGVRRTVRLAARKGQVSGAVCGGVGGDCRSGLKPYGRYVVDSHLHSPMVANPADEYLRQVDGYDEGDQNGHRVRDPEQPLVGSLSTDHVPKSIELVRPRRKLPRLGPWGTSSG